MPALEPSRHWQLQKHQQIVERSSPTAFAQLSEVAMPHLVAFLQQNFRQLDPHFQETAVIDCLLSYYAAPEKYNPEKLTLFAYLRMAARHDLLNSIDHANRTNHPLIELDEPAIQAQLVSEDGVESDTFLLEEWTKNGSDLSRKAILRTFEAKLDSSERQLFLLMLNGVRETEPYAEIMRIDHLTMPEKRREVKRAKDRLKKKLNRFVERYKI